MTGHVLVGEVKSNLDFERSGGQLDIGRSVWCLAALHWKGYQHMSASELQNSEFA